MEDHLTRIIENNYWPCTSEKCKKGLSGVIKQAIASKTIDVDNIQRLTSVLKGGPLSEKSINILYRLLTLTSTLPLAPNTLPSLSDCLTLLFLKSDQCSKECLYSDLTEYFTQTFALMPTLQAATSFKFAFTNIVYMRKYVNEVMAKTPSTSYSQWLNQEKATIDAEFEKAAKQGKDERVIIFDNGQDYARFTSLMAMLYFKVLEVWEDNKEAKVLMAKRVCEALVTMARQADVQEAHFVMQALVSLVEGTTGDEIAECIAPDRSVYKQQKMFGETALVKWYDTGYGKIVIAEEDFEFTLEKLLEISHMVYMRSNDTKLLILWNKLLQAWYSLLPRDVRPQCLWLFTELTSKISMNFEKLDSKDKSLFLDFLLVLHQVTFVSASSITITKKHTPKYMLASEGGGSNKFTPTMHSEASLLLFNDLANNQKLLNDYKFCITIHRILYGYIEKVESKDKNIVQVMKDLGVIVWSDSTYPERNTKRVNSRAEALGGQERVLKEYYQDTELAQIFTKRELKFIVNYMYQLVERLIDKDPYTLSLAVNLIPECNQKLEEELRNKISEEADEGNAEFVYMNFMMRGYKYFQINSDKMISDNLFNSTFMRMKKALAIKGNERFVPGFAQTLQELLYRNISSSSISVGPLRSPIETLLKFENIPNLNNSFPYSFAIYSLICKQEPTWELNEFFTFAYDRLKTLLTSEEKESWVLFPKFRKIPNDSVNSKSTKGSTQKKAEESKSTIKVKNKKRSDEAMARFYQVRNFIEFVMISAEALLSIAFAEILVEDENVFVAHRPKYWNQWSTKLPKLEVFTLTTECESWAFINANMVFPKFLYHKDSLIRNFHWMFEVRYNYPAEPYRNVGAKDKQKLKEIIISLITTILGQFVKCLKDEDNYEYFYGDGACIDLLHTQKDFYLLLIAKATSRCLHLWSTMMAFTNNQECYDLIEEIKSLWDNNDGKSIRQSFQFITMTVDSLSVGIELGKELDTFMDIDLNQ